MRCIVDGNQCVARVQSGPFRNHASDVLRALTALGNASVDRIVGEAEIAAVAIPHCQKTALSSAYESKVSLRRTVSAALN